ncbi:tandem-95 repeat protein [Urbifossiella limnaea]|uniref:Hemolysin, plasmid n=1 Tax=Urbifossiella limnaea TaxID=2528023 RepID=A0A517XMP9_9BACT|nr:Ig-like domain-containing protein [Urbifossiella limnaea]QDU18781.1 Hemolysin, plasmid [Urbifossiella limnaea]
MRRQPPPPARRPLPRLRRPHLGLEFLEGRDVPATLTLALDTAALVENGPAATGTVTRTGDLSQALAVAVANSDATEASAPAAVTIAAGQASATFAVSPVDDTIVDGTQGVTLTATAQTGSLVVRPDPTFGAGGFADTPALRGGSSLNPGGVLVRPDGSIVAAASVADGGQGWAVQFQNADGSGALTSYVFFPGYADPGTAYAVVPQGNKILVAGDARNNGVTDWAVARLNANGTLDFTFGNNGTLVIPHLGYDSIYDLEVAADGTLLVGGYWADSPDFRVTRLTADGAVIGSASVPVRAAQVDERAYGSVADMALDASGRLILAGTATVYTASTGAEKERLSAVVRLDANLTPDATFGPGGVRTLTGSSFGTFDRADVVAVEAVGTNVVVGGTAWGANQTNGRFAVARFTADGTLDTSFAGDGTTTLSLGAAGDLDNAEAFDLAVQADGKLVVAGYSWRTGNGTNQALARFAADGTPDANFNGTGFYVAADYPQQASFEQLNAVALQADGRLVAQAGGSVSVTNGNVTTSVYKQWLGRFDMATGEALTATASLTVADDDPSLTLTISPATFGENGGSATATVTRSNLDMDSELVVTLTSSDATEADVPVTISLAAGQASATFLVTGVDDAEPDGTRAVTITAAAGGLTATAGVTVTDDEPAGPSLVVTISPAGVLEQTGAAAATGTVTRYGFPLDQPLVVTLTSSDTTEATVPGTVTIPAGATSATFAVVTVDDALTDGTQAVTITATATAAGLSGAISYDTSWGSGGWVSGYVRGRVAVGADGKLVVAGTAGTVGSNADFSVRRFNPNGTTDTTFGSSGYVQLNPVGASDQVEAVLVQPDGMVVVAGSGVTTGTTTGEMVVVRLRANGTLDATGFGTGGVVRLTFGSGVAAGVLDAALQADGKVVLSGFIGTDFAVVRLNADGSPDATFGTGGVVRTAALSAAGAKAHGVAVAPDGKIVAVGVDGEGTASSVLVVARYSAAGVPDGSFGNSGVSTVASSGYDQRGTDVAVRADGKVLVGVRLRNTSNGTYDYAVMRFNADGSPDNGFGTGGAYVEPTASAVGGPARLVHQADGRVLLAGTAGSFYVRFVRLTADGGVENTANGAWSASSTEGLAQDAAGNIYLAYNYGSGGTSGYVDRYKSAGVAVSGAAGLSVLDNEPFAAAPDSFTTAEETPLTVGGSGVRGNDTVAAPLSATSVTAEVVTGPTRGTLAFNADGSFTYTPQADFAGTDTFTYRLRDGAGVSNVATVTLTVTNVNDAPVAATDAYTVAEDTVLTVAGTTGTTSLTMVSDAGDWIGQGRTYNLSPSTGNFSVSGSASYLTVNYQNPNNGSDYWTLQFRSRFDTEPLAVGQYLGATRAAFRTPGTPGMDITGQHRGSNTLTGFFTVLQIEVSPTGQVTRFSADFEQHSEGGTPALRGSVRFNYSPAAIGVLFNDTDPDADVLTAAVVTGPAHGQLALNPNGTFTYTPDANYSGADSFTYVASDGQLTSNVATVNLTVTAVNDAPVGAADSATTAEDTAVVIDVLANDTDIENNALTIGALTQPQFGSVAVQNGRVLYTPPANWNGTTSFTYRPSDVVGAGPNGNVTTVTVTVTPAPDAPVAGANSYTTDQGVTLSVSAPGVLGNDADADGDALAAAVVTGPANGVLTLNADGSFTYAPDPAFYGTDSFTYAAADGTGLSATATVTLTVLRTNDPPVAQDDGATTTEDVQVGIAVIANDSDPNGDAIVAVMYTQPANGTAAYSPNDGRIYYLPRANWSGTDTFTYRAYDGRAYSDPATVTVTVLPVNDAPVAFNDFFQVTEDTPRTVTLVEPNRPLGVLWNDTDVEGTALTATVVAGPTSGTLTLNADGSFTYTPAPNFSGTDQFYYRASDGQAQGNVALVTLSVTPVNDVPVGNPDFLTTTEDTPLAIPYGAAAGAVTANDTDADDASSLLTIGAYTQPANGTLEPGVTFGGLIYRPRANWSGTDTFQYRPMDRGQLLGNWTTVTITVNPVNDAPTGRPDSYTVAEDGVLSVPAAGVLANDTDVEGSPFTAQLVTGPANGSLSLAADGSFTYTPNANFVGTDAFTYRPVEGTLQGAITTVTLTVTAVNDPPTANPDAYTVAEDGVLTVSGTAVALDQQSLLTGQFYNAGLSGTNWQQSVVAGRAGTLASFDLFIYSASTVGAAFDAVVYRGAPWQTSTPLYTFRLTVTAAMLNQWVTFDTTAAGIALAAGETFTIGTRNGSGPTVGILGSFSANGESYAPGRLWYNGSALGTGSAYNQDLAFRTRLAGVGGVLGNDTDPENNPLAAVLVTGPAHGTLSLGADGGFTYTPAANYFGPDSFTYKASDGALDSNTTTVSLTVTPVNDAPTIADVPTLTIPEDAGPVTVTLTGIGAGPGESQPLTVQVASSNPALIPTPTLGYTSPGGTGTVTFAPAANAGGTANITVIVNDGALSRSVSFEVIVSPVNDAPAGLPDSVTTNEDTAATGNVLGNDGDIDGDPVTAQLASNPTNGTLALNPNGTFTYTPNADWNGTDTFTYRPFDGQLAGDPVTVTIDVRPVNDAPAAAADNGTVTEDGVITVAVLANDTDADGDALTVTGATNGANGTVTVTPTGVTYTPAADFFGTDSFTYTASDGNGGTATGTVSVTVSPVDDAPTLDTIAAVTVAEDAGPQTVSLGGIGAGGGESQPLTVTATSSNPALLPTPTISYASPNATGTLTFTPAADAFGSATITVVVGDGSLTTTRTFTVTVTPVNDAPTLNALGNVSILEDAAQQAVSLSGIGAGPNESQALTVTATSSNPALIPTPAVTYTSPGATGTLRFTPAANASGTATITVTVGDGALTVSRQFTVTVTPVNDAPNFTAGASQSVAAGSGPRTVSGWATGISRGPADEAGQGLAFTVTTTNAALFVAAPTIDAAGALSFVPEANATGTATVTVVLKDTGGTADGGADTSATRTFTITLTSNGLPTTPGVRLVGTGLVITGANTNDSITVSPQSNNRVRVQGSLNGSSVNQTFTGVTAVRVDAEGGNDSINLSALALPTWVDAGAGNDTVTGGSGADQIYLGDGNDTADGGGGNDLVAGGTGEDLIQGGAGDDDLYGGDGDDFVIGGPGVDDLYGGLGNDILVGGTAAVRSGSDSLRKVLTDWNPAATGTGGYANIRSRLRITDDGAADRLRGDAGTDWFWVGGADLELDTPEQRN